MFTNLQNFISTLLILYYLHLMYPHYFKMKTTFKGWEVDSNKYNAMFDNNLKYLREFESKNPGLQSRLELGLSWMEYAMRKYVIIATNLIN